MVEWISVEDRLPKPAPNTQLDKHSVWVLAYFIYGTITAAMWYHNRNVWYLGTFSENADKVTHWMPLPKPPAAAADQPHQPE